MRNPAASFARQTRIILIFVCFLTSAEAQHGGGGHSAGGHFGGGHSSGRHTGGQHMNGGRSGGRHFGWLHFRSGRRAGRLREANTPDRSRLLPTELAKGATPVRALPPPHIRPVPLLWFPAASGFFFSSEFRHQRGCFFGRFPRFHSSGCFFNGFTQVCFFEPALPLFFFSAGVDPFLSPLAFDGSSLNTADDLNFPDIMQSRIAEDLPRSGPMDADTSNSRSATVATVDAAPATDAKPGERFFLLILKNGTRHAVTNYWLADGYVEYVSQDGTRSHIPLEALDLQHTVIENSGRGLSFVLRSAPEDTR